MQRPPLNEIPLFEAIAPIVGAATATINITMSTGQWDRLLQMAYDAGWTLLELDHKEKVVAAYRRRLSG